MYGKYTNANVFFLTTVTSTALDKRIRIYTLRVGNVL
jgi:hypothetical protein